MDLKALIFNHAKNIPGWRTKRKIVVFSVDDYGNVRLDSKKARSSLDKNGLKPYSMFDTHDTLESRDDLYALYDVLSSVKDKSGSHAIFTPFALSCNLNFEKMQEEGFKQVYVENLPKTYEKLATIYPKVYNQSWEAWEEGIKIGILSPQYHSREHFNFTTIQNRLNVQDFELLTVLKNRTLTNLSSKNDETPYTIALGYQSFAENTMLSKIIEDGIKQFEVVFGNKPSCFMPPSATMSPVHHDKLSSLGIKAVDTAKYKKYQYSDLKYRKEFRWTGKQIKGIPTKFIVRNCVFEPLQQPKSLNICKQMIAAAFNMNKPAIISSHRINFVGSIDESTRTRSMQELKELLKWIVLIYPDVEFLSLSALVNEMAVE